MCRAGGSTHLIPSGEFAFQQFLASRIPPRELARRNNEAEFHCYLSRSVNQKSLVLIFRISHHRTLTAPLAYCFVKQEPTSGHFVARRENKETLSLTFPYFGTVEAYQRVADVDCGWSEPNCSTFEDYQMSMSKRYQMTLR